MLLELRVENYAVIDNVAVEFAPGLNLLTGETGAGKSILIDALTLLLGDKASADVIRHGTEKAVVAAVFEADAAGIAGVLEENGVDSDGDQVILRREITANGRGRVFINNQPATVSVLKQLAPYLAVIHAQNAAVLGFDPESRLALLDSYAGSDLGATAEAHAKWHDIATRIADLDRDEQDRLRLLDLWKFQRDEIEQADLKTGEDETLETEKRVLANSERIYTAAMGAFDHLYESEGSASEQLKAAARQLEELARFDEKFREQAAAVESARITVEDIGTSLRDYAEGIQASPERLAEVEDRLALIDRLKRKYGKPTQHASVAGGSPAGTLDLVIAYGEELAGKLNDMENKDEVLRVLKKELAAAAGNYLEVARALSRRRYEAAKKLEKTVEGEINDLAMKARFKIEIGGTDEESNWTAHGFDQVAYMISANPGEPLGPVDEIASGGELSRVMLALKASVEAGKSRSKKDPAHQRTLVFDEIDTGIGGRAAEAVGKKLKALSKTKQVLCITHLPQIASFADHHYLIEKKEVSGRTKTTVRPLDLEDRTEEVARMLSGAKLTETSLKHAEQMLKANG